jgi:hypothetical protein
VIVNIPIEPIEMRYSADLIRWFDVALKDRKHISIMPKPLTGEIREGAFLDVIGTIHYKASQIKAIAEAVDNGTIPRNDRVVFLMHDGWFPVDQLAYMRDMLNCPEWKFVGLFRAGTYDKWDQLAQHGMYQWGEDLENSWFKIYDRVIVASHFHMDMLLEQRKVPPHKFAVIPWKEEVPADLIGIKKENWVIFPHRHHPEKLDGVFKNVDVFPYSWVDPWSVCESRAQAELEGKLKRRYYELLAKSKICVSFSLQETYGHAMIESVLLGCIPLVPDRLSYKELYPDCFRYKGEGEFRRKLAEMMHEGENYHKTMLEALREKFRYDSRQFFPSLFSEIDSL